RADRLRRGRGRRAVAPAGPGEGPLVRPRDQAGGPGGARPGRLAPLTRAPPHRMVWASLKSGMLKAGCPTCCGAGGAHLTARAWRRVMQASAVPGYGYRYRRWVLDSLRYVDVQDLATGGDHIPELNDVYVDVALVSRAAHQVSDDPLSLAPQDT